MSPIDQLVLDSQKQHQAYYELFGTNPVRGDGLRELGNYTRGVGQQERTVRDGAIALNFSNAVSGPYIQATGWDNLPLDGAAGGADVAADAVDTSADVNVNGANDVSSNAAAEASEIAAVPDPESPAGQAAIVAIIEKYHGKSTATVEGSSATEQAAGTQAAESDDKSDDDKDDDDKDHGSEDPLGGGMGGGSGLMDVLSQLLGAGGGMGSGMMNPMSQGMPMSPMSDPLGSTMGAGSTPAADPFADPFGGSNATPATTAAGYSSAADPFAAAPSMGTGTVTTADATTTGAADPFAQPDTTGTGTDGDQNSEDNTDGEGDGGGDPAAAAAPQDDVDLSAFSGGDGGEVPADPTASAAAS